MSDLTLAEGTVFVDELVPSPPDYDRKQFAELFALVRAIVDDELAFARQPTFVPIRRLRGAIAEARNLARRDSTAPTAIAVLERAMHTYDVAHRDPREQ